VTTVLRQALAPIRPTPSLVAALLSSALVPTAASAASTSVYGGVATSSDTFSPLVIKTNGSRITQVAMRWETSCSSGYRFVFKGVFKYAGAMPKGNGVPGGTLVVGQSKLFANPISRTGRFTAELFGSVDIGSTDVIATETTKISGTLKKTRGAGSFSAQTVIGPLVAGPTPPSDYQADVCDSGTWKWKVRRGPGVFGGASEQGEPVVVLYNPKKRAVSDFLFGWRADNCQGSGTWWDFPDDYGDFPVRRDGRFGDAFTDSQPGPDGGKVVFGYNIDGQLKGKKASGTFGVSPLIMDASGNPVGGCSTPDLSWSAVRG
jgi:hypothetical protein